MQTNKNRSVVATAAPRHGTPWWQPLPGAVLASAVLAGVIMWHPRLGQPVMPSLHAMSFQVAVLAGPKQAEQQAPQNAAQKAPAVTPAQHPQDAPTAAVAERKNSLPKAVAAAQDSAPGPEVAKPAEVLPPALVSMPGGRLSAVDGPTGDLPDPFKVGPRQVFLRLFVNESGHVVRGGIVRGGNDPTRDAMLLRAMVSRTYSTAKLIRVPGTEPIWQMDLVLDYGTGEYLP